MGKHWNTGYTLIGNNILIDKEIDTYELRIFLIIESYHYLEKKRFSITYLEKLTGISRSKIHKSLKRLINKKYIRMIDQGNYANKTPATYTASKSFKVSLEDKKESKEKEENYCSSEEQHFDTGKNHCSPEEQHCSPEEQHCSPENTKELTIKKLTIKEREREETTNDNIFTNKLEINHDQPVKHQNQPLNNTKNKEIERNKTRVSENKQDIEIVIDHWNSLSGLQFKDSSLTPDTKIRLCGYIFRKKKKGVKLEDMLKAMENYSKTLNEPNSWYKSKYTLLSFTGVNGRKEQLSKFLPMNFEPQEYSNNKSSGSIATEEDIRRNEKKFGDKLL